MILGYNYAFHTNLNTEHQSARNTVASTYIKYNALRLSVCLKLIISVILISYVVLETVRGVALSYKL